LDEYSIRFVTGMLANAEEWAKRSPGNRNHQQTLKYYRQLRRLHLRRVCFEFS
jgi:hypothetical protein